MWRYQTLLNQNLQIIIEISAGIIALLFGPFTYESDFRPYGKLLFNVIFPSAISLALGIKTDLRQKDIWKFVGAWLMFRAIVLVLVALAGVATRRDLGHVTINWLCLSWVSTVVLGIPLVSAAVGTQYGPLGAVAAISSYIFQLPVMLVMLEMHGGRTEYAPPEGQRIPLEVVHPLASPYNYSGRIHLENQGTKTEDQADGQNVQDTRDPAGAVEAQEGLPRDSPGHRGGSGGESGGGNRGESGGASAAVNRSNTSKFWVLSRAQWKLIARRILGNIIMWTIVVSLIVSVTTLGPKYLNPGTDLKPNCDYIPGLGFIAMTLTAFAACTEPIALFLTGMFITRNRPSLSKLWRAGLYMFAKLILVPILMIGCCFAVGLNGPTARASVLISVLPVAPAAVSVATIYGIGVEEIVENVFFGNLLVLPSTLGWMGVMDAMDLFPAPAPAGDFKNACSTPAMPPSAPIGG